MNINNCIEYMLSLKNKYRYFNNKEKYHSLSY